MRSFLFVPGDSVRKFESAKKTAADALILDLEDSIAPDQKVAARGITRDMLDARNPDSEDLHPRQRARYRDDARRPRRRDAGPARRHRAAEMRRRCRRQSSGALSRRLRGGVRYRAGHHADRRGRDRDRAGGDEAARLRGRQPAAVGHDVGCGGSRRFARRLAQPHRRPLSRPVPAGARPLPDQRRRRRRRGDRHHRHRHRRSDRA